jgi:nucleoside-diphosphate-sugar epimerase
MVEGSILDRAALDEAMSGSEVIFHEAAIPSVARSVVSPRATNDANVTGTIEVMLAAGPLNETVRDVRQRVVGVDQQRSANRFFCVLQLFPAGIVPIDQII